MPVDQLRRDMQTIGQYDLVEKVAEGGMGTVYKGRHRISGEIVAVKVVPPHIASNPVYLKRFEQEYNAAKVLDHPNIVRALDFGREDGIPFLVMEFVEGESLGQRLDRENRLDEGEGIRIISEVAQGLGRAHELGLVHRDVKPDNILLTDDGHVKLTDLGLVKEIDADLNLTRTGRGLGTPHFMAPEQFRNAKNADARCDIYSLSATLYMIVTGTLPFQSAGPLDAWMRKVKNDIAPPSQLVPDLSPRVDWAIRRAMSPDPAHRPASCREFVEDLTGETDRVQTPVEEAALDVTLANLWHVLYRDPDDIIHATRESTEGVRRVLQDGSLGDAGELRLSRRPQGPFEPARNFAEFRDLMVAIPRRTAGLAPVVSAPPVADEFEEVAPSLHDQPMTPLPGRMKVATPGPVSAGPHIDLASHAHSSFDWLVWFTLLVLALTAAVVGYLILPGLRWRWF
jgi:eukaryotic-like serine/threonine-protein kinase